MSLPRETLAFPHNLRHTLGLGRPRPPHRWLIIRTRNLRRLLGSLPLPAHPHPSPGQSLTRPRPCPGIGLRCRAPSQFEHKVYVKPFSERFPGAKVYVCPGQWSWPINLPPGFRVDGTLCEGGRVYSSSCANAPPPPVPPSPLSLSPPLPSPSAVESLPALESSTPSLGARGQSWPARSRYLLRCSSHLEAMTSVLGSEHPKGER